MPTIDSTLVSIAFQFPLLVLFFLFTKWLLERQDKKEIARDAINAEEKKVLIASFQTQIREQKEAHEKEYNVALVKYETIASKVLEVVASQVEAMRILNKTVEQSTNLRGIEDKMNAMLKEAERGK